MLGSMTIAGFLLGYLIDYWFDTQPLFLFALGVFGFIGGMLKVKELIIEPDKQNEADELNHNQW